MELRQLKSFEAIARHRHFTRAAGELHLAQSALSQQIRKLEAELGFQLLERTSRRVELTEAGRLVLRRAQRMLAEADAVRSDLDDLRGLVRGTVAIGAMMPVGRFDLPELLAAFHERHPGVEISLREGAASEMLRLIRRDELDLGLSFVTARDAGEGVAVEQLAEEEIVIIAGRGTPLAARDRVTLSDLDGVELVGFLKGSAMRAAFDEALVQAGVRPRFGFESLQLEMVRALAARGLGATIVPRTFALTPGPDIAVLALDPPFTLPVNLLTRTERQPTPAAAAFLAMLREAVAEPSTA